jgi:excisionase family DNA binding protein
MTTASKEFTPLLTVSDVAKILNVSTKTVHRRIKEGKLPAIRDGDLIRVRRDDLEAYIAMHRTGGF